MTLHALLLSVVLSLTHPESRWVRIFWVRLLATRLACDRSAVVFADGER
jgi:hypothetical protein